jgi:hypothetical protein
MAEKPYRNRIANVGIGDGESVLSAPVEDTSVVDTIVNEPSIVDTKPKKVIWPQKYVCRTKCWVSSKCDMFYPGQIVEFYEGEFVPSHFDKM